MKQILLTIFFLILIVQDTYCACGEIWFYIADNQNSNYMVVARRISVNDPLFGEDFMEVNSNQYDYVISDEPNFQSTWENYDFFLGFDYLRDQSNLCWPLIGEGKIEFSIYIYDQPHDYLVFRFEIDLVHYPIPPLSFADFTFFYSSYDNSLTAYTNYIYTEIINNSFVNSWELQGTQREVSRYVKDVELTNFLATGPEPNIKTIFTTASMGFPDPENFQTGEEYPPGTFAPLWRGVYYGLTVSHTTYTKNNIVYNFRNWFEIENYSSSTTFRILENTGRFRSDFYPVYPLTVSNNLEGGNGGNFQLTWQNPPKTQTWQFGTPYNAFQYSYNLDVYSVEAPTPMQNLGTTWYFRKWNDGSPNNIKSNLQITTPTTITAYYKGNLRSNDQNGISSGSQRKLVRTDNGIYHIVYESMGEVWYTHSLTTDFNGSWSQDYSINEGYGQAKNPSIDFEGNNVKIVMELYDPNYWSEAVIFLMSWEPDINGNYYLSGFEDVQYYSPSYFGNAKPVIAYNYGVVFIAYRKNSTGGIYQKSKWNNNGNWQWGSEDPIPNTNSNSINPSVAGISSWIYLAYEDSYTIRYIRGYATSLSWQYSYYDTISTGSGYSYNYNPSISLARYAYPVVSWIGYNGIGIGKITGEDGGEENVHKVVVRRGYGAGSQWSSLLKAGDNVVTTNNNSTNSSSNEETVIAWSEGIGLSYNSKWVRRVNTSYTNTHDISHNGKQNQISNGTSLENIEGAVFSINSTPFLISLTTTDFNEQFGTGGGEIGKKSDLIELSYGREGVIYKRGIEFLFNIGDVIVADSVIKFVEQPDTILYSSTEELNSVVRTVPFFLSPSTELYFTDFYYVLNDSLADSVLTAEDMVNFKVELVNEQTGQVVGTFDNITFKKEYLDRYANISYQVNCSSISPGDYYLRLVTTVEGDAEYYLGNLQNSGEGLDKKKYRQINFDGTAMPASYDLSQNYPNPFNPMTTIRYQLPEAGNVTLKVYDILGAEVATLVDAFQNEGRYEVNFNASNLASGVYIYRLNVNEYVNVKKMIILK